MAYTTDKKSIGLDVLTELTITQSDLHIVGDVSDSGRAKAITQNHLEDYIANSTNFIDELVGNTYFTTEISGNIEVVTDGTTIIGDGTTGNPLVATAGAGAGIVKARSTDTTPGYLDDKISITSTDGSVTVTKTINNPSGNEDIEYDLSATPNINVENVVLFEDFTSCFTESDGAGVNNIPFLYANYFVGTSVGTFNTFSELDHPGVVEFSALPSSGEFLIYKLRNSAGGGIPLDNDFDVELLTKNVYNGVAGQHRTTYSLNGGTTTPYVQVRGESGSNNITYNLFSTGGTTTIPASGTWFKPKFVYTSGTLELWIDGVLIDSEVGNFGANEGGWISIDVFEAGGGNITVSTDYSKLNYTVTR